MTRHDRLIVRVVWVDLPHLFGVTDLKLTESRFDHSASHLVHNASSDVLSTPWTDRLSAPRNRRQIVRLCVTLACIASSSLLGAQDSAEAPASREATADAIKRAADFFSHQVSTDGGYVWRYSADLKLREGESKVDPSTSWVQPPGSPTVGLAYLQAYQMTEIDELLKAAVRTGHHLANGQLKSGGWTYRIETNARQRARYAYRNTAESRGRNTTTLDDDTTQSALRFLMRLDAELEFQDGAIHDCVEFALKSLLKAQYPNGGWPQRYDAPPDRGDFPVRKAAFPSDWSRKYPGRNYMGFYTLNDNTLADTIETMLLASQVYNDPSYRKAAERGGDFLLLAQMPEPQPAWAQQYNNRMEPAWARKFEPPAVTGGESKGAIRVLIRLYLATGQQKYIDSIPSALDYLEESRLPDGRLARFYELKTNRPLYFTREYELTYDADDLPTHYGFIVSGSLDSLRRQLESARATDVPITPRDLRLPAKSSPGRRRAAELINALDERGAWVTPGSLRYHSADEQVNRIIDSSVFARNLIALAAYLRELKQ